MSLGYSNLVYQSQSIQSEKLTRTAQALEVENLSQQNLASSQQNVLATSTIKLLNFLKVKAYKNFSTIALTLIFLAIVIKLDLMKQGSSLIIVINNISSDKSVGKIFDYFTSKSINYNPVFVLFTDNLVSYSTLMKSNGVYIYKRIQDGTENKLKILNILKKFDEKYFLYIEDYVQLPQPQLLQQCLSYLQEYPQVYQITPSKLNDGTFPNITIIYAQSFSLVFSITRKSMFLEFEQQNKPCIEQKDKKKPLPQNIKDDEIKLKETFQSKLGQHYILNPNLDWKKQKLTDQVQINLEKLGIDKNIQIGSNFDYLNLGTSETFKKIDQWQKSLPYKKYDFAYNASLEKPIQPIKLSEFQNYNQSIHYLQLIKTTSTRKLSIFILSYLLAQFPQDPIAKQIQYWGIQQRYNTSRPVRETRMCIFSSGYNVIKQDRYKGYFQSIEKMNYTNYRVVLVDDGSTDNSAQVFYDFLSSKESYRLKNRVTIVKNLIRIGSVGNLYTRIRQFCRQDQVVINVDSDDEFLGAFSLQAFNQLYQDDNVWVANSHIILTDWKIKELFLAGYSLEHEPIQYHQMVDVWFGTGIKTFRKALLDKVPISHSLQYHFNPNENRLEPRFYESASDRFMMHPLYELAGLQRIKFLPFVTYKYNNQLPQHEKNNCYVQHQRFDAVKARLKTPFKKLKKITDSAEIVSQYTCQKKVLETLQKQFESYCKCKKIVAQMQQK